MKEEKEKQLIKRRRAIRENSIIFIQFVLIFSSLLNKFKYIFKLFVVLNIDKKNYNEQIMKLDAALEIKNTYYCKNLQKGRSFITHEDTNSHEAYQILSRAFSNLEIEHLKDLVYIFFNDLRLSLYCKRYFITDALEDAENS